MLLCCPMELDDLVSVSLIHKRCFENGWSDASFESLLKNPSVGGLIACLDQRIVGFILYQTVADEAEILAFAIDPQHQSNGFGRGMLKKFMSVMQKKAVRVIFLDVSEDNKIALKLYLNYAFEIKGKRRHYYSQTKGPKKTAFLLTCEL